MVGRTRTEDNCSTEKSARSRYDVLYDLIQTSYKMRGLGYLLSQDLEMEIIPNDIDEIRQGIAMIAYDLAAQVYSLTREMEEIV